MEQRQEIVGEFGVREACVELVDALQIACARRDAPVRDSDYGLNTYADDDVMDFETIDRLRQICREKFAPTRISGFGYVLVFQPLSPFTGYGYVEISVGEYVYRMTFGDGAVEIPETGDVTAGRFKPVLFTLPCVVKGFIEANITFSGEIPRDCLIQVLDHLCEYPELIEGGRWDGDIADASVYLRDALDSILEKLGYDSRVRLRGERDRVAKKLRSVSEDRDRYRRLLDDERERRQRAASLDPNVIAELERLRRMRPLIPISRRTRLMILGILAYAGVVFGIPPAYDWWRERQDPSAFVSADRDLDTMGIPEGTSDSMVIFMASVPTYGPKATVTDTLLSPYEVSKFFFDGKIVAVDVVSGWYGLKKTRMVQFLLPGKTSGEILPGMKPGDDMVGQVSFAQVLDMVADTSPEREDELKEFICWVVRKTFRRVDWSDVELDKSGLSFERDGSGKVVKIRYDGDGKDDFIVVHEARPSEVAGTSLMPRVSYSKKGCPLVVNGELQLYTGVHQPLLVPEDLLKPASLMEGGVKLSGSKYKASFDFLGLTGDQLAQVIREYFVDRDIGRFQLFDRDGHFNPGSTLSHLVDPDDAFVAAVDRFVITPAFDGKESPTLGEKADFGRRVLGDMIDYHTERGGVSSRTPPLITVMRAYGGRDCDILANVAASLYSRLGLRVALLFAEQDPKKVDPSDVHVGHVLVGLDPEEIEGFYDEKTAMILENSDGRRWVVSEFERPFGESVLLANLGSPFYNPDHSDYYVAHIEQVDPVRDDALVTTPGSLPVMEVDDGAESSVKKKAKK